MKTRFFASGKLSFTRTLLAAGGVLLGSATFAQTNAGAVPGKLDWSDRHFVSKVLDSGQDQLQLAQLAAERASNSDVRAFAQRIVDDHAKENSDLTSLANAKNVKVDNDADKTRAYRRLSKATAGEFDREFLSHIIDEHEKAVKNLEKASTNAKDTAVRDFASKHLTEERDHLAQAQKLQTSVMPTGR
jgi:putative membrane protein